jgi:transcriptional regulator with XRE-family HTH domain
MDASRLKAHREALGLTQMDLARESGVGRRSIQRAEAQGRCSALVLRALEETLDELALGPRSAADAAPDWRPAKRPGDDLSWHVPPECQGQTVERSYAVEGDYLYRRVYDRSDRTERYEVREIGPAEEPEPWNREPR